MRELELQAQVADYLCLHYPNALFHSDYGSGLKLTIGQARKQHRLQGGRRAWPDMFIAETTVEWAMDHGYAPSYGLFIELKREGVRLRKKDGSWANAHIKEQAEMLEQLRQRGYEAEFACGFDEAKKIIDEYLGDPETEEVEF